MADITYNYGNEKYKINTYDNIINTCLWIKNAFEYALHEKGELDISTYIDFESENTAYHCTSLDDFKRYAFNKQIVCKSLYMSVSCRENRYSKLISVFATRQTGDDTEQIFAISSKDELLISNVRYALSCELKHETMVRETSCPNITQISYEDNSIHISDSDIANSVIGNGNKTEKAEDVVEEKWYVKLFWQFIIPIAVTVVATLILLWLGLSI